MGKHFKAEDFKNIRKALFIGAHCDDTELRAGPIVRRLLRAGAECIEWTMIDGPWGVSVPGQDGVRKSVDMMALRESENRKAAASIGLKEPYFFHLRASHLYKEVLDLNKFRKNIPDFSSREALSQTIDDAVYTGQPMGIFAFYQPEFHKKFVDMLVETAPDIIFTHSLNDLHIDHYGVCTMVLRSVMEAQRLKLGKLAETPVMMWRAGGNGGCDRSAPTHFLEVSEDDVARSDEAMQFYTSQFRPEMLDGYVRKKCSAYGRLCGKPFAVALTEQHHPDPSLNLHRNPYEYIADEVRTDLTPEIIPL